MALVQRILAVLLGLIFVASALVFASLALGVILAVGLVVWGWVWWRTRGRLPQDRGGAGAVVEGEYRDITPVERLQESERRP